MWFSGFVVLGGFTGLGFRAGWVFEVVVRQQFFGITNFGFAGWVCAFWYFGYFGVLVMFSCLFELGCVLWFLDLVVWGLLVLVLSGWETGV